MADQDTVPDDAPPEIAIGRAMLAARRAGRRDKPIALAYGLPVSRVRRLIEDAERWDGSPAGIDRDNWAVQRGLPRSLRLVIEYALSERARRGGGDWIGPNWTLDMAATLSPEELLQQPGMGRGKVEKIRAWLESHGRSLGPPPSDLARMNYRQGERSLQATLDAARRMALAAGAEETADLRERLRRTLAELDRAG